MRGDDPATISKIRMSDMVLPACAGMIPNLFELLITQSSAPRMRGDDPDSPSPSTAVFQCSPHARG